MVLLYVGNPSLVVGFLLGQGFLIVSSEIPLLAGAWTTCQAPTWPKISWGIRLTSQNNILTSSKEASPRNSNIGMIGDGLHAYIGEGACIEAAHKNECLPIARVTPCTCQVMLGHEGLQPLIHSWMILGLPSLAFDPRCTLLHITPFFKWKTPIDPEFHGESEYLFNFLKGQETGKI